MVIEQKKLDDLEAIKVLDPSNMWERMRTVPEQISSAAAQVSAMAFPPSYRDAKAVVFAGMGGSAVAGDFVQSVLSLGLRTPIFVVSRGYSLPLWVDENTLVFISSYSGNTAETLACFDDGVRRSAMLVVFTSGGELYQKAKGAGVPIFDVAGFVYPGFPRDTLEPRTTVVASFIGSLGILCDLELAQFGGDLDVDKLQRVSKSVLDKYSPTMPTSTNFAKQLAIGLAGKVVVVYGTDFLDSVARRWKTQINENANSWAFSEMFPDANHNSVNGYQLEENMQGNVEVVFIVPGPPFEARTPEKIAKARQLFEGKEVSVRVVSIEEDLKELKTADTHNPALWYTHELILQILIGSCLGDWVSYYMALLTEVDPAPVPHISALKGIK